MTEIALAQLRGFFFVKVGGGGGGERLDLIIKEGT